MHNNNFNILCMHSVSLTYIMIDPQSFIFMFVHFKIIFQLLFFILQVGLWCDNVYVVSRF